MLIHNGKIIAGGSPKELKTKYLTSPIIQLECSDPLKAMEILEKEKWVNEVSMFGVNLHINIYNEKKDSENLKKILGKNNIKIQRSGKVIPSLEDVFIHLIEKNNSVKDGNK